MVHQCSGYAAHQQGGPLVAFDFERRNIGDHDIAIDIEYCGVCHSDLSMVENEWGYSQYPMVPGHEIIGRVADVGSQVKKFRVGDRAGIGTIVDSCRECANCKNDHEQYCTDIPTQTYGSLDRKAEGLTYGGYSANYVVDARFAFLVPFSPDPAGAAPLLCAGITTYSPFRRWKVGPGQRVAIVGFGGLERVAVKIVHVMGAHVAVITTSGSKEEDALLMGADEVLLSNDADAMAGAAG